jgi:hypothetical protein
MECEDLILDEIDGQLAQQMQPLLVSHLAACDNAARSRCRPTSIRRWESTISTIPVRGPVLAEIDLVRRDTSLFVRISFVVELAGLAAVAGAGALVVQHWFPRLLLGGPRVAAASCAWAPGSRWQIRLLRPPELFFRQRA